MGSTKPPARVLIVDDNEDATRTLAALLTKQGCETCMAFNGAQALEAAEAFKPDLVLLDISMPVMDGYEACRRMRSTAWGKDIRILALTGWSHDADRRRCLAAGFDEHLVKPLGRVQVESLLA